MTFREACLIVEALDHLDHDGIADECLNKLNEAGDNLFVFQLERGTGGSVIAIVDVADGRKWYRNAWGNWVQR